MNMFQQYFYDYGRFHNTLMNVMIHIVFVPIITVTLGLIIGHFAENSWKLSFNPFYLLFLVVGPVWVYVDFICGLITTLEYPLIFYLLKGTDLSFFGFSHLQVISILQVVAWITQFIGHGVFEGRKPALIHNILLTTNAPLFVNLELMYWILGYRSQDINEAKVHISRDIKEYKKSFKTNID